MHPRKSRTPYGLDKDQVRNGLNLKPDCRLLHSNPSNPRNSHARTTPDDRSQVRRHSAPIVRRNHSWESREWSGLDLSKRAVEMYKAGARKFLSKKQGPLRLTQKPSTGTTRPSTSRTLWLL